MGSSNTKVQCLLRPGQSGKTRTVQDLIREYEGYAELFLGRDALPLNIVICSNNRHLVHQTTVRMNTDLFDESEGSELSDEGPADAQVNGSCFSWVSGTKGVISPGELAFNIITGKVSMVVCCAHKKRLDYVYELVAKLNEQGQVELQGSSDALIVKGLVSILLFVYSHSTPQEILNTAPDFLKTLGFESHLSPSRTNGLYSMIKQIKLYATAFDYLLKTKK
jgi:hypothetical protein